MCVLIDWIPFPADWTRADQADPQKRLFIPLIAIIILIIVNSESSWIILPLRMEWSI
jgi:hypothetical protein